MKAATFCTSQPVAVVDISIHAAREGGDLFFRLYPNSAKISIHAAREGGDPAFLFLRLKSARFQSTPPVKAATGLINGRLSSESISIHAAREGGDVQPAKEFAPEQISIHAAREGGDTTARIFSKLNEYFNPRRP